MERFADMTRFDVMELILFVAALIAVVPLLGRYLAKVFQDGPYPFNDALNWVEKGIYRVCSIDPLNEMNWKVYLKALLYFNFIGVAFLFFLQLTQGALPFNPQHFGSISWPTALNTAISFVTNTNWQSYNPESSVSYLTQCLGFTTQNFLSAGTGNAVLLAFIRGFNRRNSELIGNFWCDLTKMVIYVFLPLAFFLALLLVSQGVIQNFQPYQEAITWENESQLLPGGPAASQIAIKQLGTNGGGFFNANSAHPYENPTPLSNFMEVFAILAIPASLTYMYGSLVGMKKQGLVILWVMFIFWIFSLSIALTSEWSGNPAMGFDPVLEGKETRIGVTNSILWAITTTATSNGSVNAMQDSLSPLAGGMALFQMTLGEIIFGGIGTGLCSMLMFVLLTVFIAGLMVGRSPEYLGKKIEGVEISWAIIAVIAPAALTLLGTSLTLLIPSEVAKLTNKGPHGLTEIIYAFASTASGNGSAMEGINGFSYYYELIFSFTMLTSRLAIVIPSLGIAGSLAAKKFNPTTPGTFKTDNALFGVLLSCVILTISALTFFPAFALGPIVEHLLMLKGQAF